MTTTAETTAPEPATAALRARPLLAVDTYEFPAPWEITARKHIRGDEPYLEGHYPDFTIFPGVFSIESVIQAVRLTTEYSTAGTSEPELESIRSVRFSVPLLPGDTLTVHCVCKLEDGSRLRAKANCVNDRGQRTATVTADFRLVAAAAEDEAGKETEASADA